MRFVNNSKANFVVLIIVIFLKRSCAQISNTSISPATSCGNIPDIRFPFYITPDDFTSYSAAMYELRCENNHTLINLYRYYGQFMGYQRYCPSAASLFFSEIRRRYWYHVEAINYSNYTIRLVAPNVRENNSCSSLPTYSLDINDRIINFSFKEEIGYLKNANETRARARVFKLAQPVTLLRCEKAVNNSQDIDASLCFANRSRGYAYAVVGRDLSVSDLEDSCGVELRTLISTRKSNFSSFREIHNELAFGFELSFLPSNCYIDEGSGQDTCSFYYPSHTYNIDYPSHTYYYEKAPSAMKVVLTGIRNGAEFFVNEVLVYIVGIPRMVCVVIVIWILAYKWYPRHSSMDDGIEEFLQSNNNLMPIRYSYWEIRIMTRIFKEKLGEGGFGSVYKGTLSNGRLVAVKMLGKSKANGQDFMNEVATIGRIHHANVVHLIGFCATGSKRALVYDFMPNGSLDKYIFRKEGTTSTHHSLGYKEIFNVSLGVAQGINYLHQGCDMQILHFDIKPHNILLDENFAPRVSDFGLARLCPLDNSVVSLTAARGTIGYIAPELFYKNIGGVSHKSDVYSFGMLLMEMANKRKNVNANATKSSQIYFPTWIFDQYSQGNDMELEEEAAEEELEMVKKMIIVALWCIQLKPCDRPSMSKVMEMLEGDLESLEMPPKPYLFPQANDRDQDPNLGFEEATESSWSSTPTEEDSTEISLISNT